MEIKVYVVSAFSKEGQGGNRAGVVFNEPILTKEQKIAISNQLGYSETVFVSDSKVADYRLEYFTPTEEVDLCGHATIGFFVLLMHLGRSEKTTYQIETKSGILLITLNEGLVFMEQNNPIYYEEVEIQDLATSFDISKIDTNDAIRIVSTGLKDILVPIKRGELQNITPNFEAIASVSQQYDVVGLHLYEIVEDYILCRNFAPRYDINEEAATGTSNGALACYLYEMNRLQRSSYRFNQGESLGLPSEIQVTLKTDDENKVTRVNVGGRGYFEEIKYIKI